MQKAKSREQIDCAELFRRRAERFAELARMEGREIKPYTSREVPLFRALPLQAQRSIVENFDQYVSIMEAIKSEKASLLSNCHALWRALTLYRMIPTSDLFTIVRDSDVLEIYDLQSLQIFRSLTFFSLSSYSLEELYSVPWFELYNRDPENEKISMELMASFLRGEITGTTVRDIEPYDVREAKRPYRRCARIKPLYVAPLFDRNGEIVALVNAFRPIRSWDENEHGELIDPQVLKDSLIRKATDL